MAHLVSVCTLFQIEFKFTLGPLHLVFVSMSSNFVCTKVAFFHKYHPILCPIISWHSHFPGLLKNSLPKTISF